MRSAINLILGVALIVIGSLLGEGYKDSLYLYWLSTSAFFVLCSQFLINQLEKMNDQLVTYKDKVSIFTMLKENKRNIIQISILPKERIIVNREVKIELFVTSAIDIKIKPGIKLITDNQWDIKLSNQSMIGRFYGGKYDYVLNNLTFNIIDNKFASFSFFVKFTNNGKQNFKIVLDNGEIQGELETTLTVHSS